MWTIRLYKALNPILRSKFLRKLTKMSKWSKNIEMAKKCQSFVKMAQFDNRIVSLGWGGPKGP